MQPDTAAVQITIWTDFEVPSTRRCATAAHAFGLGDNALLNLGCSRYVVQFESGAPAIGRRRVYERGEYRLGDYYSAEAACPAEAAANVCPVFQTLVPR